MLSKRLETVANLVTTKSVIDVGCDHGYLDIYLTNKGIKCTATDISKHCIKKADENFKRLNLDIVTVCTDGLNNINIKKEDTIIISGMGADTIIKILNRKLDNDLIISSNNNLEKLRRFICNHGYYIEKEVFVLENNKPYVIIKFKKGNIKYSDFDYIIGPKINDYNYFNFMIKKYEDILSKIPNKYQNKKNYYKELIEKLNKKCD